MKHTAILAVMLNLGVAGVYAQQHLVKIRRERFAGLIHLS